MHRGVRCDGKMSCDISLKQPLLDKKKIYFHVKAASYGFIYRFTPHAFESNKHLDFFRDSSTSSAVS